MNNHFECCRVCTKRHVGCHSTCEDYISAKKAHYEYCDKKKDVIGITSLSGRQYMNAAARLYLRKKAKRGKND